MPPQKAVFTLKAFAKDQVMFSVCSVILDEIFFGEDENWDVYGPLALSVRLGLVKDILTESLSPSVLEDLLNTILAKDEGVEATVRYLALQLLLVEGVRSLTVGNFPESYYSMVLEATAKCGWGLHDLDLRGLWVREEHKNGLLKLLRKLADIRKLTIRYTCDDDMLATLGKYSNNLQKLDVAGAKDITAEGLRKLCWNPSRVAMDSLTHSLKIVDIGGPGSQNICPKLVSYLLLNLPHLVSLGSYENTGAAVEIALKEHPGKEFNLRYLHDTKTSSAKYLALLRSCPMLQAVYLDCPKDTVVHNLNSFKHLKEIKFHKVRWSDLKMLLMKMGDRLRSLFLIQLFGELEIYDLVRLCPNLQRLEVHCSAMTCAQALEPSHFKDLKELLIYKNRMSNECMRQILSRCLLTEHVAIGECDLTDADLTMCLVEQGLAKLRDFWLGLAPHLTFQSVEAILSHCPGLTSLGNLAGWSLHPAEIDLLRIQVLATNTDLKIHEIGSDENEWVALEG